MKLSINWWEVKRRMAEKQIESYVELKRLSGVGKNTLGSDGSFTSNTLAKLAGTLECDPRELIRVECTDHAPTPQRGNHAAVFAART
jgi:DNA-binding Xre family transcriptional regulator